MGACMSGEPFRIDMPYIQVNDSLENSAQPRHSHHYSEIIDVKEDRWNHLKRSTESLRDLQEGKASGRHRHLGSQRRELNEEMPPDNDFDGHRKWEGKQELKHDLDYVVIESFALSNCEKTHLKPRKIQPQLVHVGPERLLRNLTSSHAGPECLPRNLTSSHAGPECLPRNLTNSHVGPECLRRNLTSSHTGPERLLRNLTNSTEDRDADKFGIGLSSSLILQSNRPDEHMSTAICTNTDVCKYSRAMHCKRDEPVQHLFKFHRNSLRIKREECCYCVSHCCCEDYIPVLSREIPKSIKREEDLSIGNVCQYHVDYLRQKYNFDKHDYAVSNEIGPADCHLSLEGMSGCSNDAGLANGCSGFKEMTGYNPPLDITTADCPYLELFWVEIDTCQNEYLHSALKDGKGENIFNEDEIVRNKVKPRNGESNGKTCNRWIQNLTTYKQRGTKFPCESEEDSGITTPDVSFSTGSIDIKQNKCPSSVELEMNNSNPPGGNFVTVETQSGLRIEAENIQLKWQRGIESLTITPSLAKTKSKLSIKTPDGNDIRGVQIQTQSETICLTPL